MRDADASAPCPDGHDDTVRLLSTFAAPGITLTRGTILSRWRLLRRGVRLRQLTQPEVPPDRAETATFTSETRRRSG